MKELPVWIIVKWQDIANLLAKLIDIPAALIMYSENEHMEVCVASATSGNPYEVGAREKWYGLYCETVIKTQKELLIPNALKDIHWNENPDLKLGMISYLGYPINYPDNNHFGTICVLDTKENRYSAEYRQLILHFRDIIENDLSLFHEFRTKEEILSKELIRRNNELSNKNHELLEKERLLSGILDNLQDGYFRADTDGFITIVNPTALQMFGYDSSGEIIGLSAWNLYAAKKYREDLFRELNKCGSVKDYVCQGIRKDKTTFWISINAQYVKDHNNEIIGTEGVVRNITQRIKTRIQLEKAKDKVEESEKRFRTIFEQSADGIVIHETNLNIINCNNAVAIILGYDSLNEFIGKNILELSPSYQEGGVSSEEKGSKHIEECLRSGHTRFEWIFLKKNNTSSTFDIILSKIKYHNRTVIHAIWRDITQTKNYQKDLILAKERAEESDRLKTAFLNNMSHEIRTPMNGIIGFTGMLDSDKRSEAQKREFIKIIQKSSNQLLNIVDDILDIATIEAGQVRIREEETDLYEFCIDLLTEYQPEAQRKNLKLISSKQACQKSKVFVDLPKIKQIMGNLLNNAIKFTKEGVIQFKCCFIEDEIQFSVSDTGIGIEKRLHEHIFDRFRQVELTATRDYGGAGLGLSICKGLVEEMGGRIWVESELGSGSTFFFTIPFKQAVNFRNEVYQSPTYEIEDYSAFTVLIAEDEEHNSLYVSEVLADLQMKLIFVKNGLEAVQYIKKHKNVDLILMDIKMPVMNGYEATIEIKKINPDIPIIAITAHAFTGDKEKAMKVGCDDYLSKPVSGERLKKHIDKGLIRLKKK